MLKVGITGGIGSGKSTVCNILKNLGVPVFTSDEVGKNLLDNDQDLMASIVKEFGKDMYNSDNKIDRARLASIIFNDPREMEKVISLVHPKVNEEFNSWCLKFERRAYVVKEAAVLLESGLYHDLDKIVNVFATKEARIKRVMNRDDASRQDIEKRMRFQYTDTERNELADFIIMNDDRRDLLSQVMELHEILLNEHSKEKGLFK